MKKLMALCLSLLMVLSMCSFTVLAEGEVDFSAIANGQPQKFVTSNLALGEHTITSSNEAVIATDGTVTRPLFEDATVSVAIDGGTAVDVVVKAQTTNVLYSEDFSVDSSLESQKFAEYPQWSTGTVTNDTAISNGKLNVDHGTNADDDAGYLWLYYKPVAISGTRPVTFSFEVSDVTSLATGIDIRLAGTKYDSEGNKVGDFSGQTVMSMRSGNKFSGYGTGHTASAKNPATIKYDPTTGEFWLNGTAATVNLFNKGTTTADKTVSKVVLTNIVFIDAANTARGLYSIDNFVQYEDVPTIEALQNANPAQKADYYSKYLAEDYVTNGGNFNALTTNLKFTPDEELIEGVSITWTSNNESVIATDGTVKRPLTEGATVTLTGTLKVEGAENVVKTYTAYVLPAKVVGASKIIDFDTYGSVSDFNVTSPATAEVVDVTAGNKALKMTGGAFIVEAICHNFTNIPSFTNAEKLVLEFKVKTTGHSTAGTNNVSNFGLYVNGKSTAEFINYGGSLRINNTLQNATPNDWHGSSGTSIAVNTNSDVYANCMIVVNLADDTVMQYVNGTPITKAPFATRDNDYTAVTSLGFYVQDRASQATFYFDDIKVYTEQSVDSAIATLSNAEKVAYFKNLIQNSEIGAVKVVGEQLDLDNGYADYDLATIGASVSWTSDQTAYISNDGTLLKLAAAGSNLVANMTATITAGDVNDTVSFAVPVADGTTLVKALDFSDTSVSANAASYVTDTDSAHGSVLYLANTTTGHKASGSIQTIDGAGCTDRVILSADVKYVNGDSVSYGGIGFKTIAGYNGINIYFNYKTQRIQIQSTMAGMDAGGQKLSVDADKVVFFDMPASVIAKGEGEWVNVMVDHNVLSQTMYIYIDGVLLNEMPILQANMKLPANGGSAVRGFSLELSRSGEVWVDNVTFKRYDDKDAVEVNAALNAALFDYASPYNKPVLTNCALPAMTIGKSWWLSGTLFNRDLDESGALKATNPAGYTYVTDGPAITWKIGNETVTAINVASPKEVTMTVTAAANGISESKTFTRMLAPAAVRGLGVNGTSAFNGIWLDSAEATDKVIVATYLDNKLVGTTVHALSENENYVDSTGVLKNMSTQHPAATAAYDQIKIFVVDADGITPLAFANSELHD